MRRTSSKLCNGLRDGRSGSTDDGVQSRSIFVDGIVCPDGRYWLAECVKDYVVKTSAGDGGQRWHDRPIALVRVPHRQDCGAANTLPTLGCRYT